MQYDIAIMGGSMVGTALAKGLADMGCRVALIEKASRDRFAIQDTPDLRCSAINLASEALLERLGIWSGILEERTCPYTHLSVDEHWPQKPFSFLDNRTTFDCEDLGESHLGHIVENAVLQKVSQDVLTHHDGVDLFFGLEMSYIEEGQDYHLLKLSDGSDLSAQLVIGADGARSAIRAFSGIGCFYDEYEQHVFAALITYQGEPQQETWQTFYPSGPRAFLPMASVGGEHYASLVWYDKPAAVQRLCEHSPEDLVSEIQSAFPARLPQMTQVVKSGRFPIAKMHAHQYGSNGFILVGDAAHTINPLAGQGLNLGYQDVEALLTAIEVAWKAHRSLRDQDIVKHYEAQRRRPNQAMMMAMDVFYYSFSNDIKPLKWLRSASLGVANKLGLPKQLVMQYATGLRSDLPFPFR